MKQISVKFRKCNQQFEKFAQIIKCNSSKILVRRLFLVLVLNEICVVKWRMLLKLGALFTVEYVTSVWYAVMKGELVNLCELCFNWHSLSL
jgi:hypothetical protein